MKTPLLILCFISAFLSGRAQDAEWLIDKKQLRSFETFRIDSGDLVLVTRQRLDGDSLRTILRSIISDELRSKGYSPSQDSTRGFSVSFVAEIVERIEEGAVGPLGQRPATMPSEVDQPKTWTQFIRQGSLAIVVTDNASKEAIWRSRVSIERGGYQMDEIMRASVYRAFRKYPRHKR